MHKNAYYENAVRSRDNFIRNLHKSISHPQWVLIAQYSISMHLDYYHDPHIDWTGISGCPIPSLSATWTSSWSVTTAHISLEQAWTWLKKKL